MALAPDLDETRSVPAWRVKLAAFWRWWTGELAAAMPERIAALRGAGRVPVVALEGEELVMVEPRSAIGPDSRVALETLDAPRRRAAVQAMLERAGEARARIRACLAPGEALVRRVTLPAATQENLRQVLAFEMDRLTPFRVDDVYFDQRVLGHDAAAGTISVLLGVARREIVDRRIEALRALGLDVQGVTVREDLAAGSGSIDLMPTEQRGARETVRERAIRQGLMIAVLALFMTALALPVWRKREAVISVMPAVSRAEAEAKATDVIARDVERQVTDYNFLLGRKYATYPALAYIEDLSRLLPDNTWLQQLDLKQSGKLREIQITGETPSSSKLIELLQQSQVMQNARTSGTVTRGSVPGTERFMIAAEASPRVAPEAHGVLEGVALPAAPIANPGAPPQPAAVPAQVGAPPIQPAATAQPATPAVPAKVQVVPAKPDAKAAPSPAPAK